MGYQPWKFGPKFARGVFVEQRGEARWQKCCEWSSSDSEAEEPLLYALFTLTFLIWSFLSSEQLANDHEQQIAFIQEICDTIGANAVTNEKEIEEALQVLSRMIREGGITLWNDYFNTIFFAIQQIISQDLERHFNIIKISALKTLKELCLVQPKRLVAKTELLVMIILNAHECEDATVVRAAEDCGAAVANHLPTNTCMHLLLTVIDDKHSKYHQLSGAIKMLGSMLSKLPPEEVAELLPTVVPRMTQLKLVDVYRERMLKRSDGGASA